VPQFKKKTNHKLSSPETIYIAGEYPTIQPFQYTEETSFKSNGGNFLEYKQVRF
jgi:hypothetical protein